MPEHLRPFVPRFRAEKKPVPDTERERQVFQDIYKTIVSQGQEVLRRDIKRSWRGSDCRIHKPLTDPDGKIRRLEATNLTIKEGTIMLWQPFALPTALAYGTIEGTDRFALVGATHSRPSLIDQQIDPRTTYAPELLLGEFPGLFSKVQDAQAFFITTLSQDTQIGVMTGSINPNSQRSKVFRIEDLRARNIKQTVLKDVAGFIAEGIRDTFVNKPH